MIDPLEICKNQLNRIMKEFSVDLNEAYDRAIFGFVYMDGDLERKAQGCSGKNEFDWYTLAFEELSNEKK